MNPNEFYALSKLEGAIEIMATHSDNVRKRLLAAYYSLGALRENDFPESMRATWKQIASKLTRRGPIVNDAGEAEVGAVEHTLGRMQNRTAAKIAEELFGLYRALAAQRSQSSTLP